jgi:hypothetical protein
VGGECWMLAAACMLFALAASCCLPDADLAVARKTFIPSIVWCKILTLSLFGAKVLRFHCRRLRDPICMEFGSYRCFLKYHCCSLINTNEQLFGFAYE